jgi:hypothetical protein
MSFGENLVAQTIGGVFDWYGSEWNLANSVCNALRLVSKGQDAEAIKLIPPESIYRVRANLAETIERMENWPKWYVNYSLTCLRPFYGEEVCHIENYKKLLRLL